jgi:hypothetical protein
LILPHHHCLMWQDHWLILIASSSLPPAVGVRVCVHARARVYVYIYTLTNTQMAPAGANRVLRGAGEDTRDRKWALPPQPSSSPPVPRSLFISSPLSHHKQNLLLITMHVHTYILNTIHRPRTPLIMLRVLPVKKDLRFVYFSMSHKYVCHITMYVTYVCQTSVCHISKSEQPACHMRRRMHACKASVT